MRFQARIILENFILLEAKTRVEISILTESKTADGPLKIVEDANFFFIFAYLFFFIFAFFAKERLNFFLTFFIVSCCCCCLFGGGFCTFRNKLKLYKFL